MKIAESLSVNVMVLVWEKSAEKNSENIKIFTFNKAIFNRYFLRILFRDFHLIFSP